MAVESCESDKLMGTARYFGPFSLERVATIEAPIKVIYSVARACPQRSASVPHGSGFSISIPCIRSAIRFLRQFGIVETV